MICLHSNAQAPYSELLYNPTKLYISKTFSAVYSTASVHFPLGACFQQVFKRSCKTMTHSMSNMFDIDEVREGLTVSLHLPLRCSRVLFSVESKP